MAFTSGQWGPDTFIDNAGNTVLIGATVTASGYVCTVDELGNLTVTGPASDAVTLTVTPATGASYTQVVRVGPLAAEIETKDAAVEAAAASDATTKAAAAQAAAIAAAATDATTKASAAQTAAVAAAAAAGNATYSPLTALPLSAAAYGVVGDGNDAAGTGTDNTAALTAALLAAETQGRALYLPPGVYKVTTTLPLPSGVTFYGDGPSVCTIFNTTAGQPAVASKNWLTVYGGFPAGRCAIRNMTVRAEGANTASHGLVIRDYYSVVENVVANQCGGDGFVVAASNQAGTVIGSTLVENHYSRLLANQCKGYGFHQNTATPVVTDSFVSELVVRGSTSLGGVRIPFAAGWQVRGLHTYGSFTGPGVEMDRMWGSILDGAQIESGWTGQGLRLAGFQRAGIIDNIHVAMSATGTGVEVTQDTTLYPTAGPVIGSLSFVASDPTTGTALTWDTTSRPLYVGVLLASGENLTGLTLLGGTGATSIRVMQDARVLSKLRDSGNSNTLTVKDIPLALCNRLNWNGSGAKSVTLALPDIPTFRMVHGRLSVFGVANYNGVVRCRYDGDLIIGSKASGDAWAVYIADNIAPTGFTTAPAVTVDKTAKTMTVTFEPTATDAYGAVSYMLEHV